MTSKVVLGEHPQFLLVRLTKGDSASLVATATDDNGNPTSWPTPPALEFARVSNGFISTHTAEVSGSAAIWTLTHADVSEIWEGAHPGPTRVRVTISDPSDEVDGRVVIMAGKVSWSDGWTPADRAQRVTFTIIGPQGDPGPAGSPTEFELRGTGFPEGVVTASVGTYYTDTAATNGAIRWVKATGTGNTGWKVVYGDTGWLIIDSLLVNGATSGWGVAIRRTAATVELRAAALTIPSVEVEFLTLPEGFHMVPGARGNMIFRFNAVAAEVQSAYLGDLYALQAVADEGTINWTWTTIDQWPSTLPGIPVPL